MNYIWVTYSIHTDYIQITYYTYWSHTIYIQITYTLHTLYILVQSTYRLHTVHRSHIYSPVGTISWTTSIQLLVGHGCPLQGPGIDVPPSTAVSTVIFCVTGSPMEGISFLVHGVWNLSSLSHWHYRYSAQNWRDWDDIKNPRLHFTLIENGWFTPLQRGWTKLA